MLPAEFHKVLANIRKVEARTKRRKLLNKAEEDGSDSEDNIPKAKTDRCSHFLIRIACLGVNVHSDGQLTSQEWKSSDTKYTAGV